MKLKELIDSMGALQELSNKKLPVKTSFKLSKFLKETNHIVEAFNESKNELIKEYGEPTEDGGYKFEEDKVEIVNNEVNDLLQEDISVDIPSIEIDELGDIEIEPTLLMTLDWMIK